MKKYISFLILMLCAAGSFATDIIYGNCHYREIEGRYAGFRKTESYTTFETDDPPRLRFGLGRHAHQGSRLGHDKRPRNAV